MTQTTAFIFARGGSKGVPGKNIKPLAGKPLIAWSIEQALAVDRIERVIVSTDSVKIAEVAKKWGAEVPFMRPAELAKDDSPEWLAWRHALQYLSETKGTCPDFFISVPATSPLRLSIDIARCIDEYEKHLPDVVVTVTDAHRSPYFNMVKLDSSGLAEIAIKPATGVSRRQDVPQLFDLTTVAYVVNSSFVMECDHLFAGKVRAVNVPSERAIDIDTQTDFDIADFLMQRRLNENE